MLPPYPRPSLDGPTLLLVEDNPADVRLVRLMIEASPVGRFHVVEAATLGAALAVLGSVVVDVVMLDLALPDSTGIGTLTRMLARTQSVPIVVLTATEDEALATRMVQAGAQDYLVKGAIDARLLGRTLRHAMERHALMRDLESARVRESHRATHDALTGLPNRVLFNDRMTHALAAAQRYEEHVAVGFMDIDGFKDINDRFGHAVGDQVLIPVAHRLSGLVRQHDMVARYGGDEFTLLVERGGGRESAEALLSRFVTTVSAPLRVEGHTIDLSLSLGVAMFPDDGQSTDDLLRTADAAMYRQKAARRPRTKAPFLRSASSGAIATTPSPL
jgi:diguanylate cyclase (GGDEF)-like protein